MCPTQPEPAPTKVHGSSTCTVLEALNEISGKWAISILLLTIPGPVRFTELERQVPGISRRMLTLTLRTLERDGLLVRTVYPTVPPKVEYHATPMAHELYDALRDITTWAEKHHQVIAANRDAFDQAASTAASTHA